MISVESVLSSARSQFLVLKHFLFYYGFIKGISSFIVLPYFTLVFSSSTFDSLKSARSNLIKQRHSLRRIPKRKLHGHFLLALRLLQNYVGRWYKFKLAKCFHHVRFFGAPPKFSAAVCFVIRDQNGYHLISSLHMPPKGSMFQSAAHAKAGRRNTAGLGLHCTEGI